MLDAKTVFRGQEGGASIRELLDNHNRSIERVVPKGTYERPLKRRLGTSKSNGASVNPLDSVTNHERINQVRN